MHVMGALTSATLPSVTRPTRSLRWPVPHPDRPTPLPEPFSNTSICPSCWPRRHKQRTPLSRDPAVPHILRSLMLIHDVLTSDDMVRHVEFL